MHSKIRKLVLVAVFAAITTVFMTFKFPVAFIAPPFYKFDLSEAIVLLAGFTLGVLPAVAVELIKVLLNLLIDGTVTAGIGEISNFLMGCLLVVPASAIFRSRRSLASAVVGSVVGVAALAIGAAIINYYLLIPAYCGAFGLTVDAIVGMAAEINSGVDDLVSMVVLTTVPFNLLKGVSSALLAVLCCRPLTRALKKGGVEMD